MNMKIGELEKLTGISRTTLRYYDSEGLLNPERLENAYRRYTEQDVMSLIQIRQLNALGIELADLPKQDDSVCCANILNGLTAEEKRMEDQIEDLYQKLSRLRLHIGAYRRCLEEEPVVREENMVGTYRIFFTPPDADRDALSNVFKQWIAHVPYAYAVLRIPQRALYMQPDETCAADVGIGLLATAFNRTGETFAPPMEYAPPYKCIQSLTAITHPDRIPFSVLEPFRRYIDRHGLIPMGDLYGWVVYAPANRREPYRVSLRVAIH